MQSETLITRNGRFVGLVREIHAGDQFEGLTCNFESIGRFNSVFAAARAVLNKTMPPGAHVERS